MRIYGLGSGPSDQNLSFHEVHPTTFPQDVAGSKAVIAAAGNQLIGESLNFGKPYLALPERKHFEQLINAHFLQAMGAGRFTLLETLSHEDIARFLAELNEIKTVSSRLRGHLDGTHAAAAAVETVLARVRDGGHTMQAWTSTGLAEARPDGNS